MTSIELLERVIDCIVNEKWLVRVRVVEQIENSNVPDTDQRTNTPPRNVEALMAPGTTVQDVKALIHRVQGIATADQRLFSPNNVPLFGVVDTSSSTSLALVLRVIPLDARLKSLFDIVYIGNEQDRDSMMEQLMTPRKARDCPCPHGSLSLMQTDMQRCCSKCCHQHHDQLFQNCSKCGYTLCSRCFERDSGRTIVSCPYTQVAWIAAKLGHELARTATWYGTCCTFRRPWQFTKWHSSFGDVHPPIYSQPNYGFGPFELVVGPKRKILNKCTQLIIRYSHDVRDILCNADANISYDTAEVDMILQEDMMLQDVVRLRDAWSRLPSWQLVKTTFEYQYPDRRKEVFSSFQLVSYNYDVVVYEHSVSVDFFDYYY